MKLLSNMLCLCMVAVSIFVPMLIIPNAFADSNQDAAFDYYYVTEEGDNLCISASLVIADPFADCLFVAVRVSYVNPVNYDISCFHIYLNDLPVQTLFYIDQYPNERIAQSSFAGIFSLPDDGLNFLRLVPVITTQNAVMSETEEIENMSLYLTDFVKKLGAGYTSRAYVTKYQPYRLNSFCLVLGPAFPSLSKSL